MNTYLVGGAVRDQLLRFPYHEKDWVVVGSTPDDLLAQGYTPVGKDFPVFLHPKTHEEYALARTERKTAPGYKGFTFHTDKHISLEEDLQRRDLTINAIAMNEAGEIIDPYGGQRDLDNKYLRHVSSAFNEDPVRILRVARFMARYYHLGFRVADETLELMQQMVIQGETRALVAERVWQEMEKALHERHPEQFFITLQKCGALKDILPSASSIQNVIDTADMSSITGTLAPLLHAIDHHKLQHITNEKWTIHQAMVHFSAFCFIFNTEDIAKICQQLSAPNHFTIMATRLKQYFNLCTDSTQWSTSSLSKLFKQCDAIRKPESFKHLLNACRAIDDGDERKSADNSTRLLEALHAYQAVDHQALMQQGFEKAALGKAIQQQREQQLSDWLKRC
ncbi:hypothetical protein ACVBE9_03115 [Eionea flava]